MNTIVTDRAYIELQGMVGLGAATIKAESAALDTDDMSQGLAQRLTNVAYGKEIAFSMEQVADDQYTPKLVSEVSSQFALSMLKAEELLCHDVLNSGFSTVSGGAANMYTNPDAVALFSASHLLDSGTFSNLVTASSLSVASMETAITTMRNWVDDRGNKVMAEPMKLLVPTALEFVARRILETTLDVGTALNDINTVKGAVELVVDPWLTSSTAHFYTTTMNTAKHGLIFQRRQEVMIDQYPDNHTKNEFFSCMSRMGTGYVTAFGVVGNAGA